MLGNWTETPPASTGEPGTATMKQTPSTPAKAASGLDGLATAEHTPPVDRCVAGAPYHSPLKTASQGVVLYDADGRILATINGVQGCCNDSRYPARLDGRTNSFPEPRGGLISFGFGSAVRKLLGMRGINGSPPPDTEATSEERSKRQWASCWKAGCPRRDFKGCGRKERRGRNALRRRVAALTMCCCGAACGLAAHALLIQQPAHALLHLVLALVFIYLLVLEDHGAHLPTMAATVVAAGLQAGLCLVGSVLWLGDYAGLRRELRQRPDSLSATAMALPPTESRRSVQFWSCTPPQAALKEGRLGTSCTAQYVLLAIGYGSCLLFASTLIVLATIASVVYWTKRVQTPVFRLGGSRNGAGTAGSSNLCAVGQSGTAEREGPGGSGLERLCLDMTEQIRAAAAAAAAGSPVPQVYQKTATSAKQRSPPAT